MNLSSKDYNMISLNCHVIAVHLFSKMCNPKNRGDKFEWEDLPQMVAEDCVFKIEGITSINPRKMENAKKHADETGRKITNIMLKNSGFSNKTT